MKSESIRQIVVATDYTPLSENAVNTAAGICRRHNATLTLLHVVEHAIAFDEHHFDMDYTKELRNYAKSELRRLGDRIRSTYEIPVDEVVAYGDVVKEIAHAVHELRPDLVVVGTHGASGIRNLFIGSTAYRVIKHTNFPVLTVPGEGTWSSFRSILFPIRLIPDALEPYEHILPFIRKDQSALHILGLTSDSGPDRIDDVFSLVNKLKEWLKEDHISFDVAYDHSDNFAGRILDAAKQKKADLMVITASLDVTLKEFFIGPFAQQVIHHATVPVLCMRSH